VKYNGPKSKNLSKLKQQGGCKTFNETNHLLLDRSHEAQKIHNETNIGC